MTLQTSLSRPKKVTILGMGGIGSELETLIFQRNGAATVDAWNRKEIPLQEIKKFSGWERALDQANIIVAGEGDGDTPSFVHRFGFENFNTSVNEADIVVITAGAKRTPEMSDRAQLAEANRKIIIDFAERVRDNPLAHKAIYIIATNPVDSMTQLFQAISGVPKDQVIGLGGELDYARLVQNIANKLHIHHDRIKNAKVIGQHGAKMVPVLSQITILDANKQNPRKLTDILNPDELNQLTQDTVLASDKLIEQLETSDHFAPARAIDKMMKAIGNGKPIVASSYDKNDGSYIGRPIRFEEGKVKILPLPELGNGEEIRWQESLKACNEAMIKIPEYAKLTGSSIAA